MNDARAVALVVVRDELDFIGEVFDTAFRDARVEEQCAAKLDLIQRKNLRGFSVWVLGPEDPATWDLLK